MCLIPASGANLHPIIQISLLECAPLHCLAITIPIIPHVWAIQIINSEQPEAR
jgi:hypothetical protein